METFKREQATCPTTAVNEDDSFLKSAAFRSSNHSGSGTPKSASQEAELLNTHFLSATTARWDVVDNDRSLYSITIPLAAVAEWMPVVCPDFNGMRHTSVSSERFLMDWAYLEESAKALGQDFFSYPVYALQSAQLDDWKQAHTIENMIQSGEVCSRYKSATTVMLSVPDSQYSAVGDVMNIRMANNKAGVAGVSSQLLNLISISKHECLKLIFNVLGMLECTYISLELVSTKSVICYTRDSHRGVKLVFLLTTDLNIAYV